MRAFAADENDAVVLWDWNDGTKKLDSRRVPLDEAQTIWTTVLALELAKLRPENRAYQCQALVLGLETAYLLGDRFAGGVHPAISPALKRLVASADSALANMVLAEAIRQNRDYAAIMAASLLGERGDASVLYTASPQPAALADALGYPNRRVRFVALAAIMKLDPQTPFPGASRVPEALGYFATSASERRAVVAMPVGDHATTLAGRLASMGIEADAASRGASAVRLAQQSADLEMVLVDVDIDGPGIRDVLYALRNAPATGQVPIGLLATSERLDTAQRIAAEHQRVVAFPRPQADAALVELIERLNLVSGRASVPPAERAAMAGQALDWLGQLLAREHTLYDLQRQAPVVEAALYLPEMTERSVTALALLGTPASQRALVDFASHLSVPIAARQQAARAFAESVQRHGILLTEEEILRQYDRYNASESADAATQQVLSSLLDALESLRAAADARLTHPTAVQP
jgi:CheY-like chemotaxis protein